MLNTFKIGGNSTNVSFNTPSTGIIQKSHPKSKFTRFHSGSPMAKHMLDTDGNKLPVKRKGYSESYDYLPIVVLQLMIFSDGDLICEFILQSDLEENV